MARALKSSYMCSSCGTLHSRWAGKCSSCGQWNTVEECEEPTALVRAGSLNPISLLSDVKADEAQRKTSGLSDLDLVLGGGFVPGSLLLIGGEPGVGKSTLLLEISRNFPGKFYYFAGEESQGQVKMRAERMGIKSDRLYISREMDLDTISKRILTEKPDLVVIDSVQTVSSRNVDSTAGSVSQLRDVASGLMQVCKNSRVPVLLTGHITKEGSIAGPRVMEHMVDGVFYFESDRLNHYRILRGVKNRFGPVGEVAIFEMKTNGLSAVTSLKPGMIPYDVPGRVFSVMMEGSRPMSVEVQALVTKTAYGPGRRMAEGLDSRRLILIAAVLEKFLKMSLSDSDIFANLAGGLSADDPGLDLSLCQAIITSYREIPSERSSAYIGEVGLSGEIRSVSGIQSRVRELVGTGFKKIYLPASSIIEISDGGAELIGLEHVSELLERRANHKEVF